MPTTTPADVLARRSQVISERGCRRPGRPVRTRCGDGGALRRPPGMPVRMAGRAAIREYARQSWRRRCGWRARGNELYQTQDPKVVIVETDDRDRHHHRPVDDGDVHPDPADRGRSDCALPRLRRSPGSGGRDWRSRVRGADVGPETGSRGGWRAAPASRPSCSRRGWTTRQRPGSESSRCWHRTCASPPTTGRGWAAAPPRLAW